MAVIELSQALENIEDIEGIKLLTTQVEDADLDTMRMMADRFRQHVSESGVIVLGAVIDGSPRLVAGVTEDLVQRGIKAGDLVQYVAKQVGGGGGGRPTLAEAGGKDPAKIKGALDSVAHWIEEKIK